MGLKLSETQRRKIIVDTGVKIIHQHGGIENLTFEGIAKHAPTATSKHTVKYWFKTRDALWEAVIEADDSGLAREQAEAMGWVA